MMNIDIYTDGASKGNPGLAGYGWVMINNGSKSYKSFGVKHATNNQMELSAVIDALTKLLSKPRSSIITLNIYSDSQYVCNAFNKKWIDKWIKEDFKKIKNPILWKELVELIKLFSEPTYGKINFIWIRGHNGNEYNEEADSLAQMACGHEGIVMQGFVKI